MKKLWLAIGQIIYYVLYPLFALYLNRSARTRVVVWCENQVLLVRPWLHNGTWDLPGGGLHTLEDPAEGAKRELYEETGMVVTALRFIAKERFRSGLLNFDIHYFSVQLQERPVLMLQKAEIIEARWCTLQQIHELRINPQAVRIIEEVAPTYK